MRSEADGARCNERGGNVASGKLRMTVKASCSAGNDRAALQHTAQTFDVGYRPVGQVAQRALT